jgi:hypothetical protein
MAIAEEACRSRSDLYQPMEFGRVRGGMRKGVHRRQQSCDPRHDRPKQLARSSRWTGENDAHLLQPNLQKSLRHRFTLYTATEVLMFEAIHTRVLVQIRRLSGNLYLLETHDVNAYLLSMDIAANHTLSRRIASDEACCFAMCRLPHEPSSDLQAW